MYIFFDQKSSSSHFSAFYFPRHFSFLPIFSCCCIISFKCQFVEFCLLHFHSGPQLFYIFIIIFSSIFSFSPPAALFLSHAAPSPTPLLLLLLLTSSSVSLISPLCVTPTNPPVFCCKPKLVQVLT